ncbi:LysR family transcriptional regulator [Amycolatopsis acidiphila]|uniref:LysR family transcriptional regulator n=1 Tax=Amycolatopsis acidiphila TaxID=715473 RepID=A0A558A984_9PSEU|nr:LysR family transcriptional regulator [Amycolatopsis acidiphila]TVT20825.1 LysR family transcriptional regulator [Amycolatopsis acidiphila]UIJ58371.1 LysR family transcriptional regulator [Amycolatopsis acidiphila]GHG93694.1 LysR family transcriptional regulator [Amycolatopsis acidiphila]
MLDPVWLKTFLVVAETRSFTRAAQRLGLRQSTVSQHVRKLEQASTQQLFVRDTHSVELTADGEAMIGFAGNVIDTIDRAMSYFTGVELRGRVRFGASEDFVVGPLPEILGEFRRSHPQVDLELTVALSGVLHEQLRAGELDLVLCKRATGEDSGGALWTDPLVWVGREGIELDGDEPVPLIAYPPPSITRARALEALQRNGKRWRIVCTSGSLNGLRAAALAGLGVVVFARSLIPPGLVELPPGHGLPDPGVVEFTLTARRAALRGPTAALSDALQAGAGRLHATP